MRAARGMVLLTSALCVLGVAGCETHHRVPERPTWADVEPILRAECLHCHGGSAQVTGSGNGAVYRFDFFEMTEEACGEAASAVPASTSAGALAGLIFNSITSMKATTRPRMPPSPAPSLSDWESQTIVRWTASPDKGPVPAGNLRPTITLGAIEPTADATLRVSAVLEDPDGESAVGVLKIGALKVNMSRPGAFAGDIDTTGLEAGDTPISAVVCDGWGTATYNLGNVVIVH